MTTDQIVLQCKNAWGQPRADDSQLLIVDKELTLEDIEYFEEVGWKDYSSKTFVDKLLPELGPVMYFSSKHDLETGIVVDIRGTNYLVQFEENYDDEGEINCNKKRLILTPTNKPITLPDIEPGYRNYYLKVFGQPTWIQNELYPVDIRGNPCFHFLTIENGWGDSGNYNILLGMAGDVPSEAYFEASCC
jgi:hypothetical protein